MNAGAGIIKDIFDVFDSDLKLGGVFSELQVVDVPRDVILSIHTAAILSHHGIKISLYVYVTNNEIERIIIVDIKFLTL